MPSSKLVKGALELFKKGQDPKVAGALEDYLMGRISSPERIAMVRERLPIRPITQIPEQYTDQQIIDALMVNKRPKAFAPIEPGTVIGNRLDIPAYTQHGVYVDTSHAGGKGSPISYTRTGHLKDVSFESDPDFFARVGLGTKEQGLTPLGRELGVGKGPSAVIKGTHQPTSEEEIRRAMAEVLNDPSWTQVGMNPYRHSQFYDKADMMPVWSAEEKLQVGPLVMVPKRGLEKTDWEDPRLLMRKFEGKKYAGGGLAYLAGGSAVAKAAKEAFKKKFTPGFFHASPSNKIKEFDPNMPPSNATELAELGVEAQPRNAIFFTQDPKFSESFLPMTERGQFKTGATMYPVSLNLGKHFNIGLPENFEIVKEFSTKPSFLEAMRSSGWGTIEDPKFLKFLKKKGYDSFSVTEGGVKNVGVFDPKNIRGRFAEFDPAQAESADFMKAEGGLAKMARGGKTPAWQRKEGQNPEGGLNAKGRASYKAETGGELKRPQPEGGARRDSFCARMKGMKKKLTSAKTANDPDSRINKSLRAWNC